MHKIRGSRPARTETVLGLAVRSPGYGMTGRGPPGGYLFWFVNDAIVVPLAGQLGGHVPGSGAVAGIVDNPADSGLQHPGAGVRG